jgi:hypothetical protein
VIVQQRAVAQLAGAPEARLDLQQNNTTAVDQLGVSIAQQLVKQRLAGAPEARLDLQQKNTRT